MSHQLYVFGSNGEGQLGTPAAEIVSTPILISDPPPLAGLRAIRGGDNHTLFLTEEGIVYGVGDNRKGQLSSQLGNAPRLETFKDLNHRASLSAATCESSAYILADKASSRSWIHTEGSGQWGELGRGDEIMNTIAVSGERAPLVDPLPGAAVDFAAGAWHYVAILEDGTVYSWGKARLGQLGEQSSNKVTVPTKIEGIPFKPVKVICGKDFSYFVGDSSIGEHILLGKDKFNVDSGKPQNVKGWKDMGATWHAIFVLFDDGKLAAWGKENMWELLPTGLPLLEKIAVGSDHVLAVTKEGKLISWGWGKHGNCGDLSKIKHEVKNHMVSGFWNEISIPGEIDAIGAGFCTSFVVTK
ncbi:RCC1/BLIP-II [Cucurbitaria berberidis CBS 394.84]|uniref:RCC1/BLIP-II n=1 Tax=Cucurbitaria berberidis CBS 394.84 TaxID=1168544 RepID=A0A9P4GB35_9PLEO|nr:RCC1/BLIP-II [Cucurbitaria berberidis CBS 394.84]KAF1841990.1 RCC1/BLIP-II [Cucurbitaria berberidis CBS 394.84]